MPWFFPLRMLRLEAKKLCSDYGVANVPRSRSPTRSRTRGVAGVGINAGNWIEESLPNWSKCSDWCVMMKIDEVYPGIAGVARIIERN